MSKLLPIHVVPDKSAKDWKVKQGGENIAAARTKREALKEGRRLARLAKVELFEHGRDGKIQNRDSYGNDPQRSRG